MLDVEYKNSFGQVVAKTIAQGQDKAEWFTLLTPAYYNGFNTTPYPWQYRWMNERTKTKLASEQLISA